MKTINFLFFNIIVIFLIDFNFLESSEKSLKIKNIKSFFSDDAFSGQRFGLDCQFKIKYIINHYTGGSSLEKTLKDLEKSKNSTHYIIDQNGKIFQMIDDSKKAYHAGPSIFDVDFGLNDNSIGIEHVNFGFLELKNHVFQNENLCIILDPKEKSYVSKCKNYKKIFLKNLSGVFLNDKKKIITGANDKFFFTRFNSTQIQSSIALNKFLMRKYKIESFNVLGHSDISVPYLRKVDPGPLFPWKIFSENGIGLWAHKDELDEVNLEILQKSKDVKKAWFVKKLIEFGFHDPIYFKFNKDKKLYEKFNLRLKKAEYLKEINHMITAYNLHYRPEKEISDEFDDLDLKIIFVLNLKKNQILSCKK